MKADFAADTMSLILWLEKRRLNKDIKEIFSKSEHQDLSLLIPAMTLAEIGYLSEKGRIDSSLNFAIEWCQKHPSIIVADLTSEIVETAFRISDIPELHDRLIAATAADSKVPLIANDPAIRSSVFVETVW